MTGYRVFTICHGKVEAGAVISDLALKGAGMTIPAVIVGEEGRGRSRGVVPVDHVPLVACPDQGKDAWTSADQCPKCKAVLGPKEEGKYSRLHPVEGQVRGRLLFASIGTTKAGKPKFFTAEKADSDEFVLAVMPTPIGFRGSNNHTGDRSGTEKDYSGSDIIKFLPFPGEIIADGVIAQGTAGRAGSGTQVIAKIPKGQVFRTGYSGRLYGGPPAHYYLWDCERVIAATWDERTAADLF